MNTKDRLAKVLAPFDLNGKYPRPSRNLMVRNIEFVPSPDYPGKGIHYGEVEHQGKRWRVRRVTGSLWELVEVIK